MRERGGRQKNRSIDALEPLRERLRKLGDLSHNRPHGIDHEIQSYQKLSLNQCLRAMPAQVATAHTNFSAEDMEKILRSEGDRQSGRKQRQA
jgi:hypothetical protein